MAEAAVAGTAGTAGASMTPSTPSMPPGTRSPGATLPATHTDSGSASSVKNSTWVAILPIFAAAADFRILGFLSLWSKFRPSIYFWRRRRVARGTNLDPDLQYRGFFALCSDWSTFIRMFFYISYWIFMFEIFQGIYDLHLASFPGLETSRRRCNCCKYFQFQTRGRCAIIQYLAHRATSNKCLLYILI